MRTRLLAALIGVLTAACAGEPASTGAAGGSGGADVRVVTTVSPITNIVQNVGGDHVSVTGIVPEGTNSHTFEPAPSDAKAFAETDVVFINGLHLEEPTRDLAEANVPEGTPIVSLGERTIIARRVHLRLQLPRVGGGPESASVDQPALRETVRGDREAGALRGRSRPRPLLRPQLRGVRGRASTDSMSWSAT